MLKSTDWYYPYHSVTSLSLGQSYDYILLLWYNQDKKQQQYVIDILCGILYIDVCFHQIQITIVYGIIVVNKIKFSTFVQIHMLLRLLMIQQNCISVIDPLKCTQWPIIFKVASPGLGKLCFHYNDVIMSTMASQITNLRIFYSSVSLAFLRGIHWWPVNSPHKWPVMRKMFPFDDVIMSVHEIIQKVWVKMFGKVW